ncbi:cystathionine beta-lyase [Salsuginibacillus halophilus]|uniref:cysteine-S-conjugate beta-lyase n=1 Tax=Salsuginibacillus halophilus TaxID=517424 RepID=A0A2P8HE43_9BACI|nr:MalY/PatB family protein [Salsuginibacillus halophilus]PSL44489.1 cystathionine beta-lyase [Salsuginibacillus halophilus]
MTKEAFNERWNTNSMKWDMLEERYNNPDLWPMWVADMDFQAPQPVLEAMREVLDHGIFGYHVRPKSLYKAVQGWLSRRFSWEVNTDQMVFTPGVVPSISHLIQTFTEEGDGVIIQTPVYYPFFPLVRNHNRHLIQNPLVETESGYEINFTELESQMKEGARMIVLCSPHNPVGRVWTKAELEEVARLAEVYNVFVVSDEIHADLIFQGEHVPFVHAAKGYQVETATCLAPSKTFNIASLQLSYVVFENSSLQRRFENQLKTNFVGIDNPLASAACEAAYNEGEQWLEDLIAYLKGNIAYLKAQVAENMPEIKVFEPEGTYLVWMDFRGLGLYGEDLQTWLREEAGLALNDGHMFGEAGNGFARMNIACPRSHIEKGVQLLQHAYEQKAVK